MLKVADLREKTEVVPNKGKVSVRDSVQKYSCSLEKNAKRTDGCLEDKAESAQTDLENL